MKTTLSNPFLKRIFLFFILSLCLSKQLSYAQGWKQTPDSLKEPVLEAMYIQCEDTAEAIMVFADRSVYFASGSQAFMYVMMPEEYSIIQNIEDKAKSYVNKENLDTCNMLAVVLRKNRYILANTQNTEAETKDIKLRLDLLKKDVKGKMYNSIDKFNKRADEPDSNVVQEAKVKQEQIQKNLYTPVISKQWQCKGKVTVKALINPKGLSKRAFVSNVASDVKCAPLLAIAALRAVNLSSFTPATNLDSENIPSWITVEIEFGN